MPVEIREMTIRTEIVSQASSHSVQITQREINQLRQQLLGEVKRLISENRKRTEIKR
jgi:hypothetical protein